MTLQRWILGITLALVPGSSFAQLDFLEGTQRQEAWNN